jgi:hypothetical protein
VEVPVRRLTLLLLFPLLACGRDAPRSEPERAVYAILEANDPGEVREAVGLIGFPFHLKGCPRLWTRGECAGATPLRLWFERAGLFESFRMHDVLKSGLAELVSGRTPDFAALVAMNLREEGPSVLLPITPGDFEDEVW